MVCRANAGTDAPDLGVCLDLRDGLSGTCIQTRQLQQCTDTETDPRVDRQVCRQLGVRSIAVLPVLRGSELLGVFEVLSSRPNAFGQNELHSLQDLCGRILPVRQQAEITVKVPSEPRAKIKEVAPPDKSHIPKSSPRERGRKNHAIVTTILGGLVIAVALLLGAVVGWRFGWQTATRQIRNNSAAHRSNAQSNVGRPDQIPPSAGIPCGSAVPDVSKDGAGGVIRPGNLRR